jgi:hypothetical protein
MQCACVQACEDDNHRKLGSIPHHHPKWAQSPSKRQRESFYVRYDTDRTLNGEVFHSRNDSSWAALRPTIRLHDRLGFAPHAKGIRRPAAAVRSNVVPRAASKVQQSFVSAVRPTSDCRCGHLPHGCATSSENDRLCGKLRAYPTRIRKRSSWIQLPASQRVYRDDLISRGP